MSFLPCLKLFFFDPPWNWAWNWGLKLGPETGAWNWGLEAGLWKNGYRPWSASGSESLGLHKKQNALNDDVVAMCSDSDLQAGITSSAANLHQKFDPRIRLDAPWAWLAPRGPETGLKLAWNRGRHGNYIFKKKIQKQKATNENEND